MDYLRSLWNRQKESPQVSNVEKLTSNTSETLDHSEVQQSTWEEVNSNDNKELDPKVMEFFKDFPEPYRQKAVERFSNREGLNRFDIFRDMAMANEMKCANKGIFLEDQREYEEMMHFEKLADQKEAWENDKELFQSRDIPPWEQTVLQYIPLQPGDRMWLKLAISANLSAFGLAFLKRWWDFQKSTPTPPRGRVMKTLIGSAGFCCCLQVVAIYRLMDWGPFDRYADHRSLFDKVVDDCKKDLKIIQKHIEDNITK